MKTGEDGGEVKTARSFGEKGGVMAKARSANSSRELFGRIVVVFGEIGVEDVVDEAELPQVE